MFEQFDKLWSWGQVRQHVAVLSFSWVPRAKMSVCVSVSPSVKIMVLPDIWFFRNLVRGYRTMKLGNWHGRFFREKSISLIIHENRFWPFFRLWDLGYAWNFTGILSKWFSLTWHMLLSQQKSESALFRILTTSICVKTHFSRLWLVWKDY